jgi:hypothetical protein
MDRMEPYHDTPRSDDPNFARRLFRSMNDMMEQSTMMMMRKLHITMTPISMRGGTKDVMITNTIKGIVSSPTL